MPGHAARGSSPSRRSAAAVRIAARHQGRPAARQGPQRDDRRPAWPPPPRPRRPASTRAPARAAGAARPAPATTCTTCPAERSQPTARRLRPEVADVPAVAHRPVHVAEHAAGQRGVEELRPVVRRRPPRAAAAGPRDPGRPGSTATAQHTVVSAVSRVAAASDHRSIRATPSRNGPVPSRQTRTARIATPPSSRSVGHQPRLMRATSARTRESRAEVAGQPGSVARRSRAARRQRRRSSASVEPATQRGGERRRVVRRHEQAGPAAAGTTAEGLRQAADVRRDDRQPARQRLGDDHAVGLGARGQHQQVRRRRRRRRARRRCAGR